MTPTERIRSTVRFAQEMVLATPIDAINLFRLRALRALGRPALRRVVITPKSNAEAYARGEEGHVTWTAKRAAQVVDLIFCCPKGFVITAIMVGKQDMMFGGGVLPAENHWPTQVGRGVRFVTLKPGEDLLVKFRNDSQVDAPVPFFCIAEVRRHETWRDVCIILGHEGWDGPGKLLPEERVKTRVVEWRRLILDRLAGDALN